MQTPSRKPDPVLIASAVAIACIGNLVALTVFGILDSLPRWIAILLVVVELLAPFIVLRALQRGKK